MAVRPNADILNISDVAKVRARSLSLLFFPLPSFFHPRFFKV